MAAYLKFDRSILVKLISLKSMLLLVATAIALISALYFHVHVFTQYFIFGLFLGYGLLFCWLLRLLSNFPISEPEIFLLLGTDIVVLSFLIDASGGSQNPFTSSLLIPIALSIALLRKSWSFGLLVAAVLLYAYWTFAGNREMSHAAHNNFALHIYGMWINFFVCAVLLFIFIAYAMESLRNREKQLQEAREKILNDEKLVAIATLTASTSHALGSPLSTMAILLEDAEQQDELDKKSLHLMQQQLAVCKQHLNHIAATARSLDTSNREKINVSMLVENLKQHFDITRPEQVLSFSSDAELNGLRLSYNQSLLMALVNVIDNALQAASEATQVSLFKLNDHLCIHVLDDGPGLAKELEGKLGQKFISTKAEGWGLGVYLANSTIEKFNGNIVIENNPGGGTITKIVLPLLKNTSPS